MIVLGISPGLRALSYCVLAYHQGATLADPIAADVLHGGKSRPGVVFNLAAHARVHHMILAVVCERNPPMLVALGPACDPSEPQEHVDAVKTLIYILAVTAGATIVDVSDRKALRAALGVPTDRGIRPAVCAGIRGRVQTRDRRILLATATALAGASQRPQVAPRGGIHAHLGAT